MKCILHIGTEKTGTTSLQAFLNLNRETLAEQGYLFTKSTGLQNNRTLPVAAYNADRRDDFTHLHKIYSDKDLITYQTATINALRAELESARGIHTVIFSSEHIQSRLKTDEELSRLKDILTSLGFQQISILVYLRAPVEIANSLYTTYVIYGSPLSIPPGPENKHWCNICDHRNTITRFRKIFGMEAIIPRIYSKKDLVDGSTIIDFAQAIALPPLTEHYVMPKKKNQSMTAMGLEILHRINQEIPKFEEDQKLNPLRRNIAQYILKYLNYGDKYRMPAELMRKYEDAFRESNEWVRSEYFPHRQILFESSEISNGSQSSFQPAELDQIAKLISVLWLETYSPKPRFYSSRAYRILKTMWQQKRKFWESVKSIANR